MVASVRAYEQADPGSSLLQLFRFIRDDMGVRDVESCRAAVASADTVRAAADPFAARRQQFRATMVGRCAGATMAGVEYERLRALFTSRLAGRFPFVDSSEVAMANEVDPVAMREFFRLYDAFVAAGHEVALRSDPRMAATARQALAFLDQVTATRRFLAPVMDDDRRAPTYGLTLGERSRRWSYGEPLVVFATQPDSADRTVRGGWAPIRYARSAPSAAHERIRFYHPELKIELILPEFPAVAPAIFATR
jgi:hypothetical protein